MAMLEPRMPRMMMRAVAYESYGGARIGVLRHTLSIQMVRSLEEVSTLRLTHAEEYCEPLEKESEIAIELSWDGGREWIEPYDARFLVRKATWNILPDGTKSRSVDCVHISARLKQAIIWNLTPALRIDPERPSQGLCTVKNGGALLTESWKAAKDRGWGKGLDYRGNYNYDADNNEWQSIGGLYNQPFKLTDSLWDMLEKLKDFGALLPVWDGRTCLLRPYPAKPDVIDPRTPRWSAGQSSGGHNTLGWSNIATTVHVLGAEGKGYSIPVDSPRDWRLKEEREVSIEANWVKTEADAKVAAREAALKHYDYEEEIVRDWESQQPGALLPWYDYTVGDWIKVVNDEGEDQLLQVSQIQIEWSGGEVKGTTTFGTEIADAQARWAKRQALSQHGTVATSSTEAVRAAAKSSTPPGAIPTEQINVIGEVIENRDGTLSTLTTVSWQPPSKDAGGGELHDTPNEYLVWIGKVMNRDQGDSSYIQADYIYTNKLQASWDRAIIGERYLFWVRASTKRGGWGDWSKDPVALELNWSPTPPPAPYRPLVLETNGVLSITQARRDRRGKPLSPRITRWEISALNHDTPPGPDGYAVHAGAPIDTPAIQYPGNIGQKMDVRTRFVNVDGQKGEWSSPVTVDVQGAINMQDLVDRLSKGQALTDAAKQAAKDQVAQGYEAQRLIAQSLSESPYPPDHGTPGTSLWVAPDGRVFRMKSRFK